MEFAPVIISVVALLAAVVLSLRQIHLQRRVTHIEEERRREEIELRRRADVTAVVDRELNSRGQQVTILKIRNQGPAPAREVNFDIEGIGGGTPTIVYESVRTPVPLLDPGGERRVALEPMLGVAVMMKVSMQWQDDEGPKSKELTLNVF